MAHAVEKPKEAVPGRTRFLRSQSSGVAEAPELAEGQEAEVRRELALRRETDTSGTPAAAERAAATADAAADTAKVGLARQVPERGTPVEEEVAAAARTREAVETPTPASQAAEEASHGSWLLVAAEYERVRVELPESAAPPHWPARLRAWRFLGAHSEGTRCMPEVLPHRTSGRSR